MKVVVARDKAYFVDLFVRASNMPAIKMYEKVCSFTTFPIHIFYFCACTSCFFKEIINLPLEKLILDPHGLLILGILLEHFCWIGLCTVISGGDLPCRWGIWQQCWQPNAFYKYLRVINFSENAPHLHFRCMIALISCHCSPRGYDLKLEVGNVTIYHLAY